MLISYKNLRYGSSLSCGCYRRERAREAISPDLTGRQFGELTVLEKADSIQAGARWLCRCDCGKEVEVSYNGLQYGNRKSCGCRKKQYILGSYDSIEEAAEDRREAESVLFDGVSEHYRLWKEYADKNVGWAAANPVQVFVDRQNGKLQVALLPQIPK